MIVDMKMNIFVAIGYDIPYDPICKTFEDTKGIF